MSATFLTHFYSVSDPRIERCKKHNLMDIILLSISAVMSGSEGWEDIEKFGHIKLDWLRKYGSFESGIPRHDTIACVMCRLKSDEIESAFQSGYIHLSKILSAMSLPLMVKQHDVLFPPKKEKASSIRLVLGVVSINFF